MTTAKRIIAILGIFVCATFSWMILGETIFERTYGQNESLRSRVSSTWGTPQIQSPPTASFTETRKESQAVYEHGRTVDKLVETKQTVELKPIATRAEVSLRLDHRQKGLLWYSTYKVLFSGEYAFQNPTDEEQQITFNFPFPAEQAIYDDLSFSADGKPVSFKDDKNAVVGTVSIAPATSVHLKVGYVSHGLDTWHYRFSNEIAQVRDFQMKMTTNFRDIDFPDNTLSPTEKRLTSDGWELVWNYKDLLSGYQIGMALPEKLQPGPLAGRISFFAPVSLFFFFFLVFIITTIRGTDLHPMNYFFLAAAFFSFDLLMAYLVDHISIHLAFVIASVVSLGLVVSYMRLVAGPRFALLQCGLAQLVYLVLFSYAFFFKGFTGLAITIGSVITLFLVMQMTGRINWSEKFTRVQNAPSPAIQ